eukprot:c17700_g1_i1.p1 GENE.c17700_g1_i1~~c17700_g1_i1.p1  ORF type:complete len:160 (+),score=34.43 c17700_g1_i1:556-1035(+)
MFRYKKHMEKMNKWEEIRAKQDEIDERRAVEKRGALGMGGFHMNLEAIASGQNSQTSKLFAEIKSQSTDKQTKPEPQPEDSPSSDQGPRSPGEGNGEAPSDVPNGQDAATAEPATTSPKAQPEEHLEAKAPEPTPEELAAARAAKIAAAKARLEARKHK